jgi:hypothetical protein
LKLLNLSRLPALGLLSLSLVAFPADAGTADGGPGDAGNALAALTGNIPALVTRALTGSQFADLVARMDSRAREQAILKQALAGNLPSFLSKLIPVALSYRQPNGKTLTATIFVMPEYLAIGTDRDFLRIPMNLYTAVAVASRMGFILPTRKIVNAIYEQSAFHFSPEPMQAGPQMRSTDYYRAHNRKIEEQSRTLGVTPGALVSGHKKDVVMTNLLAGNPGKIAIYGWHRLNGAPIQPLSTVHGACYADYSHGIRLVSETVVIDGKTRSVYDVLQDPVLSRVLSDEGPIPHLRDLMNVSSGDSTCGKP